MDVTTARLQDLFVNAVRYEMPVSQRSYVWDQEGQWEPLWEDVRCFAEMSLVDLEQSAGDDLEQSAGSGEESTHFFGAVVFHRTGTRTVRVNRPVVIDGQQRLTTFQLLLKAASKVFAKHDQDAAARVGGYTENSKAFREREGDQFKVWPTRIDQKAFVYAMSDRIDLGLIRAPSLIVEAARYFYDAISDWVGVGQDAAAKLARVRALEQVLLTRVVLVVIEVEGSADPHAIFETLNARGTSLSEPDLIKNEVMRWSGIDVRAADADEALQPYWDFNDEWWGLIADDDGRARPKSNLEVFLKHWVTLCRREEVKVGSVFDAFKDHLADVRLMGREGAIKKVTSDLSSASRIYRVMEDRDDTGTWDYDRYARMLMMASHDIVPVVMRLYGSDVPREERETCLRALDSYLTRRRVCGRRQTSGPAFQQFLFDMLKVVDAGDIANASRSMVDYLWRTNVVPNDERPAWPDDRSFEEAFRDVPVYTKLGAGRVTIILKALEGHLRSTRFSEDYDLGRAQLTVEHIIPQNWGQKWNEVLMGLDQGLPQWLLGDDLEGVDETPYELEETLQNIVQFAQDFEDVSPEEIIALAGAYPDHMWDDLVELVEAARRDGSRSNDVRRGSSRNNDGRIRRLLNAESARRDRAFEEKNIEIERFQGFLDRDRIDLLNSVVHRIGNLTLVTGSLNQELSNDDWEQKKAYLEKHSVLLLNHELLRAAPRQWDQEAVEARSYSLFELARGMWPHRIA